MTKKIIMQSRRNEIYGVVGTQAGAGTTHLCFMLASYVCGVLKQRVAIYEHNSSGCFRQAGIILNNRIFRNITLFSQQDNVQLAELINMDFDCIIVDFGESYDEYKQQFLMCSKKIIVGSLSWWNINRYVGFVARIDGEHSRKHWRFLANSSVEEGIRYLRKLGISIWQIPYAPNPLRLDADSLDFLQKLTTY